jgi:AcrR family transcriptional regulator
LHFRAFSVNIYFMTETSGRGRAATRDGRDSRAVLLESAAAEFAKYGPRGTRIQDIVQAAGINERMIYHHFGSKDGLYRAVMVDQRTWLGTTWQPVLDQAAALDDPVAGMRLALTGFLQTLQSRPQVAALFMHEGLAGQPLAVPPGVGLPDSVRSMYERGQAAGAFPASVSFETAYVMAVVSLVAMSVLGGQVTEFAAQLPGDAEQVIDQVLTGMTGGARRQGGPAA